MLADAPLNADLVCVDEGADGLSVTVVRRLGGREKRLGRLADLVTAVMSRYGRHHGSVLAGGLAFFTALAITPLVIAFGALAGLLIDPTRLQEAMQRLVEQLPSAAALEPFVREITVFAQSASRTGFTLAGVIGIVLAVFGATRIVTATRQILDVAFEHPHGHRGIVMKLVSAAVILLAIAVGIALVVLITVVPVVLNALQVDAATRALVAGPLAWLVVVALVYALVRLIYHYGPAERSAIRWWSPAAAVVTVWLVLMTQGLNLYVSMSITWDVAAALLGAAAVLLLWLYLGAVGIVLGAEWEGIRTKPRRLRTGAS